MNHCDFRTCADHLVVFIPEADYVGSGFGDESNSDASLLGSAASTPSTSSNNSVSRAWKRRLVRLSTASRRRPGLRPVAAVQRTRSNTSDYSLVERFADWDRSRFTAESAGHDDPVGRFAPNVKHGPLGDVDGSEPESGCTKRAGLRTMGRPRR